MHIPHSLKGWVGLLTAISTGASFVCNMLPNAKYLDSYPRVQKAYMTTINFVATLALNFRHCLPSLDIPAPMIGITKKPTPPKE